MKALKACSCSVVRCTLLALFLSTSLWAGTLVQIRVEHANAREEPNSGADIIAVLDKGETRPVVEDVPYWYGVRLRDGRTAYVAKSLCRVVAEEEGENTEEEAGQPISELYAIPPVGTMVSVPGCTPITLNVDWTICPPGGTPGGTHETTNVQKNRVSITCSYEAMTVDQVLALRALPREVRALPMNDPRTAYLENLESRPVVLEGFLAMVKNGGAESVNCGSTTRRDIHLEITSADAGDPKLNRGEHVVTEVTPWFKERFASWTNSALGQFASYRNGYSGNIQRSPARVRMYGWLFYDDPHSGDGSVGTWRGTAWEVHPITRTEVWENGAWRAIE